VRNRFLLPAAAALVIASTAAFAELPTYEIKGFPVTRIQVAAMSSAEIRERSPVPALTFAGMPASPHQIAVLAPRPHSGGQQVARPTSQARGS
jgi:hypothetical protein